MSTKRIGDDIVFFCRCGRYLAKRIDWLVAHEHFQCPDCGVQFTSLNILRVTDGVSEENDAIRQIMKAAAENKLTD